MPTQDLQATPAALKDKGNGLLPVCSGMADAIPQDYRLLLLREGRQVVHCKAFNTAREKKLTSCSFNTRSHLFALQYYSYTLQTLANPQSLM